MPGRLLQYYRSRRRAVAEEQLVRGMFSDLAPYGNIAALVYPTTDYVNDSDVESRLHMLRNLAGGRLSCVVSADPAWKPAGYAGLPVRSLDEIAAEGTDCMLIPSTQFAEVLFQFFNVSSARRLPVVAPALPGVPHRLFLRRQLFDSLAVNPDPSVLEIGSIEHPLGGHRTTQALAETLWGRGRLTTIDIHPFTLKLAELYCASTPTNISYVAGDCREVLTNSEKSPLDFVLLHFMSDNSEDSSAMIQTFGLLEPRLSATAPVVFQSVDSAAPLPQSLQSHLRSRGYQVTVTPIAGTSTPSRFFLVARRP